MSSYVQRILQPGETVRHLATIHWITYAPGFLFLILALILLFYGKGQGRWGQVYLIASSLVAIVAAILLFRAWFHRWITEIAVTDRRVIFKTGFIRRDTNEMQMDKIESVGVDQSILGRVLDYGNISVRGTGHGEFTRIKTVAAPVEMRNQITGA